LLGREKVLKYIRNPQEHEKFKDSDRTDLNRDPFGVASNECSFRALCKPPRPPVAMTFYMDKPAPRYDGIYLFLQHFDLSGIRNYYTG